MRLDNPRVKTSSCQNCKFRPFDSQKFGRGCHKYSIHEVDEKGICKSFVRPKVRKIVSVIK